MSENKPNWVDKANFASSVLQNIQLQEVHSTLQALGELQTQKLQLELNEQQTAAREDRLRDHIWQMEQAFNAVLHDPAVTPCAICFLAQQVLDGMTQYRVTTASFRQFSDKDRLGQFICRLEKAKEDSGNKISSEQKSDMEKFLRYRAESQELVDLIKDRRSEIQKREDRIKKVKKRKEAATAKVEALRLKVGTQEEKEERVRAIRRGNSAKIVATILAIPTGAAWLSLIFLLGVPIYDLFTDGNSTGDGMMFLLGLGVLLGALILTGICSVLLGEAQSSKPIEEQITILEKEIKEADSAMIKHSQTDPPDGVFRKFEANDLEELVQRKSERDSFMLQFRQANRLPQDDSFQVNSRIQQGGATEPADDCEMSPEVQELARRADKKISAIKLYREQTGASLVEAKEAVEAFFERTHSGN